MNYMKQVAEMLGVEIGETFSIEGFTNPELHFEKNGLFDKHGNAEILLLYELLNGVSHIKKLSWKPEDGFGDYSSCCPRCHRHVVSPYELGDSRYSFCPCCGQKIDWRRK